MRAISLTGVPVCESEQLKPKKSPPTARAYSRIPNGGERIEVTTFGDVERQYVYGLPQMEHAPCDHYVAAAPTWRCAGCGYTFGRHRPGVRALYEHEIGDAYS